VLMFDVQIKLFRMRINKSIITLFLVLAMSVQLFGQQQNTAKAFPLYPYKPNKEYFKSYWTAIKKTATGPAHWGKKEWMAFGGVVVGGTVLYIYDGQIRNFFQTHRTIATDNQNTVLSLGEAGIIPFLCLVVFTFMAFLPIIQKQGRWLWPEHRLSLWAD